MKIKICGLFRMQDIAAANAARPDYVGFVFAPSRRQVDAAQATRMRRALADGIQAVGVFVNAPLEQVAGLCRRGVVDLVQLHGDEDAEYLKTLRRLVANPIIRAVRVQTPQEVLAAQELPCEFLLLDSYHRAARGGTGEAFDHALIPPLTRPFFLAGGLDERNLLEAAGLGAYAVDVSSSAETGGLKDPDKMKRLVQAARKAGL